MYIISLHLTSGTQRNCIYDDKDEATSNYMKLSSLIESGVIDSTVIVITDSFGAIVTTTVKDIAAVAFSDLYKALESDYRIKEYSARFERDFQAKQSAIVTPMIMPRN